MVDLFDANLGWIAPPLNRKASERASADREGPRDNVDARRGSEEKEEANKRGEARGKEEEKNKYWRCQGKLCR